MIPNYIPLNHIPEEISNAARTLHVYFETQGLQEWEFSYVADRRLVIKLERELNAALAENTAMREAIREVFHSFADDPPSDASWLLDDRQNHALAKLYPFTTP